MLGLMRPTQALARRVRVRGPQRPQLRGLSTGGPEKDSEKISVPSWLPGFHSATYRQGNSVGSLWKLQPSNVGETSVLAEVFPESKAALASSVLNGPLLLPWGLLTPEQVEAEVAPDHEKNLHTRIRSEAYPESTTTEHLLEIAGGREQLCAGAKEAYLFMAAKFSEIPQTDWAALDVTTPTLGKLLQTISLSYLISQVQPKVEVKRDTVKVDLLNVWIEEGTVDRADKFFFRYDLDEIKYHLLSGFVGPELRLTAGKSLLGKPPRRVCAAFAIESEETLSLEMLDTAENISNDPRKARQFWVLETDWKSDSSDPDAQDFQWRVRNINDAIVPYEGEKIPLAEVEL
ncbi:Hypothetical Protein FCC1311_065572 [Hondaea fermentalgiana]|uniref:Uncharacterized protein n=1 Tax=Hondaea fermentalgiana TaxID=2315210 RepID=A0A2R5GKT1_9STRA|nr:Hypothetical Protein FCC1311_065572 [Hondaea fermentalgiana]|eukprot:GBG30338.1 Hypothetical Protein FCC1311_065572 [Hondaea fermentalgiana]